MKAVKNKKLDPQKSIERAVALRKSVSGSEFSHEGKTYSWKSKMERVALVRKGIPYGSIEMIGTRMAMPVHQMLKIVDIPQTTYNKKQKENSVLDGRDCDFILLLTELIDFGNEVFNNEIEKFQRWLKKNNVSLGGNTPESLLDTKTKIQEVKNAKNRIECGNLA